MAEAQVQGGFDRGDELAQQQVLRRLGGGVLLVEEAGDIGKRQRVELVDGEIRVRHLESRGVQAAAVALLARAGLHEAQGALAQCVRFGLGECFAEVAGHRAPRAFVVALDLILAAQGLDGDHGTLLGEEDPFAVLFRQVLPRRIEVEAEGGEDVVEVLPRPRAGPGGDGAVLDALGLVRDHGVLRGDVDDALALAGRAHALRGVGREGVGVEALRVVARARVEEADGVRHRGDRSHRGAGPAAASGLLERNRGREAFDLVDLRIDRRADEPTCERRHRLEVAALAFAVDGAERERRLARAGHARHRDELAARDVHVHALQVVQVRAADGDLRKLRRSHAR